MDGIRIEVTGNIAKVVDKPGKITSGTVGLPIEFTFDSHWDGLKKLFVFRSGKVVKTVENAATVPWEVLVRPGFWLSVGVYGTNEEGTEVIPTIWANVCPIQDGVDPDGDPAADPTAPLWLAAQDHINNVGNPHQVTASQVGAVTHKELEDALAGLEITGGAIPPLYVTVSFDPNWNANVANYDPYSIKEYSESGGNVYLQIGDAYFALSYTNGAESYFSAVYANGLVDVYKIEAGGLVYNYKHNFALTEEGKAEIVADVIASLPVYAGEVL